MKNSSHSILIIDDEEDIRWVLKRILQEDDYLIFEAKDGVDALSLLEKQHIELAFLDLRMPRMNGMQFLSQVKEKFPTLVVIVLTAHGNVRTAVEATKLGAFDFLVKPASEDIIKMVTKNGLEKAMLLKKVERLESQLPKLQTGPIIGESDAIKHAMNLVGKVASTDLTVLITGESGTGKELFATMIHRNSPRTNKSFIAVDGGSFPETLAESELFGYEKGAFTDAKQRRLGKFELANHGTLFLDEIGNMTLDVQAKILRAIEQKKIYRVGGRNLLQIDVRIIAATNANLEEMVQKKRFREDLFYRLNAFLIEIPPLRDRKEDIPLLIDYFASTSQWASSDISISNAALDILLEYDWPGNIRELKNYIDRAILICNNKIEPQDLPSKLTNLPQNIDSKSFTSLKDAAEWGARQEEEQLIRKILKKTKWNRKKTAKLLSIDVKTLYNKMKKYEIKLTE